MIALHFHLQPQYKYELFHINFRKIAFPSTEETAENTTCRVKHCLKCLIHILNLKLRENEEIKL